MPFGLVLVKVGKFVGSKMVSKSYSLVTNISEPFEKLPFLCSLPDKKVKVGLLIHLPYKIIFSLPKTALLKLNG